MRSFFSTLTLKKVLSILIWFLILFFAITRGSFLHQKITNSIRFLERTFWWFEQTLEQRDGDPRIHIVGERNKTPVVVIGWAGWWVFGYRHLMKQEWFFDNYFMILVDQTKRKKIPNAQYLDTVYKQLEEFLTLQTPQQVKPILLAKWWWTYTALQFLHRYPEFFEQAVFINGYFNTLLDTTSNKERETFKRYWFILSPNFRKAFLEKTTIENEMNLLLQDMRVEQSLKIPILVLHGAYDLWTTSSHALFLQEAFKGILDEERVEVLLTETKQLSLRKHSELIYQFLNEFRK